MVDQCVADTRESAKISRTCWSSTTCTAPMRPRSGCSRTSARRSGLPIGLVVAYRDTEGAARVADSERRGRERVLIETFSASLDLRQPQEIELYENAFEQLAAVASYGRAARGIINRAADELAKDLSDSD